MLKNSYKKCGMLENAALKISCNFPKVTNTVCPVEAIRVNPYGMGPALM